MYIYLTVFVTHIIHKITIYIYNIDKNYIYYINLSIYFFLLKIYLKKMYFLCYIINK